MSDSLLDKAEIYVAKARRSHETDKAANTHPTPAQELEWSERERQLDAIELNLAKQRERLEMKVLV